VLVAGVATRSVWRRLFGAAGWSVVTTRPLPSGVAWTLRCARGRTCAPMPTTRLPLPPFGARSSACRSSRLWGRPRPPGPAAAGRGRGVAVVRGADPRAAHGQDPGPHRPPPAFSRPGTATGGGAAVVRGPVPAKPWWILEGNEFCVFAPRRGDEPPARTAVFEVVVDSADPVAQADWWAAALGGRREAEDGCAWARVRSSARAAGPGESRTAGLRCGRGGRGCRQGRSTCSSTPERRLTGPSTYRLTAHRTRPRWSDGATACSVSGARVGQTLDS